MKYPVSFDIDLKRNPYPGKFIAVEGIDGSGKTTQVKFLSEFFKKQEKKVFITKEPTGGVVGQLLKKIIEKEIRVPEASIQYLFAADRVSHLEEMIIPRLKKEGIVISDRYFWSAVAYGLADQEEIGDGERLLVAQSILSFYHQFILPDFTFYLDVSIETAMKRISRRHREGGREYYEEKEKLEKIVKGYKYIIDKFPKEVTVINGERSVEEVTEKIISKLPKSLK